MDLLDWIVPGAGLLGDLFGANSARAGQREANRTNMQIAREQMGFQERMSNTSYQRATEDMKKAGINPMLAFMKGGASTPGGASAHVESETGASSQIMSNAFSKMINALAVSAQTANIQATTRATEIGNKISEARVPFSAANAQFESDKIANEVVRLGQEIIKADIDIESGRLNLEQAKKLQPMLLEAQKLINQGLSSGMSKKELESNIARMFNVPFKYGGAIIEKLGEFGSGLSMKVSDLQDWVRDLAERAKAK